MEPKKKEDLIKIALLSDIHMDFDYTPGKSSKCSKVLCCRSDSGEPKNNDEIAGKWGDFNCDLPPRTFDEVLKEIREDIKPDYVFWGGDSIPHNIDTLSLKTNV
jgi:sphingomyelin phosphodiesterase